MINSTEKRKVLLGITGSIAAYKAAELLRIFVSRGYAVKVVMTEAAEKFIGKATFEALSGNPVLTSFWDEDSTSGIAHVELAEWADVVVIAPATAETISKIASGSAADPLSAIVLATKAMVVMAPAMNSNMYDNAITQHNIAFLEEKGVKFVGPDEGALACGATGRGRLSEPWEIFYAVRKALSPHDLEGQRLLITTGDTRDSMDVMRDMTQVTSSKLGTEIAREAYRRGASVTIIHGSNTPKVTHTVRCIPALDNASLITALSENVNNADMVILAGLPTQYRLAEVDGKTTFKSYIHVLDMLSEKRGAGVLPLIIAFAAGVGDEDLMFREARTLINSTCIDMLVGKFVESEDDLERDELWMINNSGMEAQIANSYKSRVAGQILNAATKMLVA